MPVMDLRDANALGFQGSPAIRCDEREIGENVRWGHAVSLRGKSIRIGHDSVIGDGVSILCPDGFSIGPCSYIGPRTSIRCWRFTAGAYLYCEEDVIVGRGSEFATEESEAILGDAVFIGTGSILNTARKLTIGHEVGIGARCGIWTHGAYLPVKEGFPAKFAPVTIRNRVWLTGQSNVLPGVTIGDNVVVAMMSLVNRDLPAGCLAGGVPAQVIEPEMYPDGLRRDVAVQELVGAWEDSLRDRGLIAMIVSDGDWAGVYTTIPREDGQCEAKRTHFDFGTRTIEGAMTPEAEDFRDHCRRYGVRFLTGKPFRSIPHAQVAKWANA